MVAFADPVPRVVNGTVLFPGHIGITYQAGNAVFAGRTAARTKVLLPDGAIITDRALSKVRNREKGHEYVERRLVALGAGPPQAEEPPAEWLRSALVAVGARRLRHGGNYRYLFPIGPARRRRAAELARLGASYPKSTAA